MRAADRVRLESECADGRSRTASPFRSSRFRRSASISRSGRSSGARRTPSTVGMAGPTGGFWSWTAGPSASRSRSTGHPASAAPGRGERSRPAALRGAAVMSVLARLLGLDRGLAEFYRTAARRPRARSTGAALLRPEAAAVPDPVRNPGQCVRLPAGHAVSLGIRLLNRLAETYGSSLDEPGGRAYAFPSPDDLAGCAPDELRVHGFSRQKALAIIELAQALAERRLDLDALGDLDDAGAVERLQALRGVGRWTAEYVLLRGLGRLHVFPGRRRRRAQQPAALARNAGAARLRRGTPGPREVGAVPGPGLPAPPAQRNAARVRDARAPRAGGGRSLRVLRWEERKGSHVDRSETRLRPAGAGDGRRILVDRIWPRGIAKADLRIDAWLKDLAPSMASGNGSGTTPRSGTRSRSATLMRSRSTRRRSSNWSRSQRGPSHPGLRRQGHRAQQRGRAQGRAGAPAPALP